MTSEWVAAGAAVAAAVIGPLAAVHVAKRQNQTAASIARRQISASLISASRQAWINKLRDAIAEFQAILLNLGFRGGHSYERGADDDRFQKAAFLRSQVALLINPAEPNHKQLMTLIDRGLSIAYAAGEDAKREMAITQASITEAAQRMLKQEWERVKAGEPDELEGKRRLSVGGPARIGVSDA